MRTKIIHALVVVALVGLAALVVAVNLWFWGRVFG